MSPLKPLNILLVEDNDEHAYIISRHLKRVKDVPEFTIERAERLTAALERVQTKNYDLVLLDLRLPDSDIHETLPRVISSSPDMPVIILSTLEDREFALKKVHEGAQDYICKSEMSSEVLIRGIYAAIERKSSEVLLRRQVEQIQLLYTFSKYAMSEDYLEHIVEHFRQSALKGLRVSAVDVVRSRSDKVDEEFLKSPLWRLDSPANLQSAEMRRQLPENWNLLGQGFQSCMVFPIRLPRKVVPFGLVLLLSRNIRFFSEEECQFIQSLGNTLAIALARGFLQRELQQRVEQLDLAHRQKDDFLATLSHELRTPLNIIKGGLELLRSTDSSTKEFHDAYEAIERNLAKEIQLVADTLDLSRITTGKMRLLPQRMDAMSAIEQVVESLSDAAAAKSIRVHFEGSRDPIMGSWDPDRFRQVLWNLLSNAIKFTPKYGDIWLMAQRNGSMLEITVRDSGQGIGAEDLPFIFEKFWQADAGINRKGMGLGLGLSIVRHITELHGGTVSVESQGLNQGTSFYLRLPVNKVQQVVAVEAESAISKPTSGDSDGGEASLKGVRTFLIDDSEDTLVLMRRLLERQGADVTESSLPRQALDILKTERFDVLISDIGMPEMDGYQMLKMLREWEDANRPDEKIPAIALSAYTSEEDVRKALAAGFQIHMSKPSPIKALCREILKLVGPAFEKQTGQVRNFP